MNTVEILKAARELISDEKRWTQEAYCRSGGRDIFVFAGKALPESAECFCSIGSLAKAGMLTITEAEKSHAYKVLAALTDEHGMEVHEYNDTHTHAEVLDLFDRAIARAEGEAA